MYTNGMQAKQPLNEINLSMFFELKYATVLTAEMINARTKFLSHLMLLLYFPEIRYNFPFSSFLLEPAGAGKKDALKMVDSTILVTGKICKGALKKTAIEYNTWMSCTEI